MNMDQIFCSNQIVIPPTLPSILKKYSKAAIRTQPYDLLVWSAAYFKAMATGGNPPVKIRLEFPLPENRQLTLGYIKLLVYQIGKEGTISRDDLSEKWNDVCLPPETLHDILRLGQFAHVIEWKKFIAIALGFLEESLKGTMIKVCEVFTEEPEGGSAMISSDLFLTLYRYLGEMDCGVSEVKPKDEELLDDAKQPCIPQKDEPEASPGQDIDSVIREIGDAESDASVDTRLEGAGAELNWPNIESGSEGTGEVGFPSEPSEEGATSKYGIEVMAPAEEVTVGKEEEEQQQENVEKTAADDFTEEAEAEVEERAEPAGDELSKTSIALIKIEALEEMKESSEPDIINEITEDVGLEVTEEKLSETESVRVILPEKEVVCEEDVESGSEMNSDISLQVKPIEKLDKVIQDGVAESISLTDLRPTLDRERRKQIVEEELEGQERRRKREEEEAAAEEQRRKLEEEAKEKYRMHVPGIGPVLPPELIDKVEEYVVCCAQRQSDMIMPRNIRHFLCPPLDLESSDRTAGLESLISEAAQNLLEPAEEQIQEPPSMIEFLKYDPELEAQSFLDTSASGESTLMTGREDIAAVSVSGYAQAVEKATSLIQLIVGERAT